MPQKCDDAALKGALLAEDLRKLMVPPSLVAHTLWVGLLSSIKPICELKATAEVVVEVVSAALSQTSAWKNLEQKICAKAVGDDVTAVETWCLQMGMLKDIVNRSWNAVVVRRCVELNTEQSKGADDSFKHFLDECKGARYTFWWAQICHKKLIKMVSKYIHIICSIYHYMVLDRPTLSDIINIGAAKSICQVFKM